MVASLRLIFKFKKRFKTPFPLLGAGVMWATAVKFLLIHDVVEAGNHATIEIANVLFFLFPAMIIVRAEEIAHLFENMAIFFAKRSKDSHDLMSKMATACGIMSTVVDNMTASLGFSRIIKELLPRDLQKKYATACSAEANNVAAGSPIGDVTTLMAWRAGVMTWWQIPLYTFFPIIVYNRVHLYFKKMQLPAVPVAQIAKEMKPHPVGPIYRFIMIVGLAGLLSAVIVTLMEMPSYYGPLFFGVGMLMLVVTLTNRKEFHGAYWGIDGETLATIAGLLGMVMALYSAGILEHWSGAMLGSNPTFWRLVLVIIAIGIISAILDNIPLMAIVLIIIGALTRDPIIWSLALLMIANGGNLSVFGTIAAIVAMHEIDGLTFWEYLKTAFVPNLIALVAQFLAWLIQSAIIMAIRGDLNVLLDFRF